MSHVFLTSKFADCSWGKVPRLQLLSCVSDTPRACVAGRGLSEGSSDVLDEHLKVRAL